MRIITFALAILIFSGVAAMMNGFGIFNYKIYEPGAKINQSDVNDILIINEPTVDTKPGILEQLADSLGFEWLYKAGKVIWRAIDMGIHFGDTITQYVPGVVGEAFATLFYSVALFIGAWGGVQLWRKVSSKGME